jgi:TatD DNase family protein
MEPKIFDTHCHIDEEAFGPDREEVIARQRESGVEAMIVPGINVASIGTVLEVCHAHPGFCYPALGLHPEDVKEDWEEQLAVVEEAIRTHRDELVAIGEIGLDYYWDKTYKEPQKEVLRRQLLLARELDLPVILHNREATEDILHIVREVQSDNTPCPDSTGPKGQCVGVFHCFTGSRETAEIILNMGFHLGIGGVLTFKNSRLADMLKELDATVRSRYPFPLLERIVLETDAPYMAPVPHRGERNESRFIALVADKLAQALQTSPQAVLEQTSANAKKLFFAK